MGWLVGLGAPPSGSHQLGIQRAIGRGQDVVSLSDQPVVLRQDLVGAVNVRTQFGVVVTSKDVQLHHKLLSGMVALALLSTVAAGLALVFCCLLDAQSDRQNALLQLCGSRKCRRRARRTAPRP